MMRQNYFQRRRVCPFSGDGSPEIDYKDVKLLRKFLTEHGKIIPRRISSVSSGKQRELAQAVKRARFIALLPYSAK